MSKDPDYFRTVSLKLSEVLSEIGVNEKMVLKRRRMFLLMETMLTTTFSSLHGPTPIYHFGSRSEGSTTNGLNSDIDILVCSEMHVIQDWGEWKPGIQNLLMIKDDATSPGYCLLQRLRDDEPLSLPIPVPEHILDRRFTISGGKWLMKNTFYNIVDIAGSVINGPASSSKGRSGCADQDFVPANNCKSWPVEARPWLVRCGIGGWPTEEMKRYCETTGCFVVPVSSKSGQYEEIEWRISTVQAERCLMFSLNITQIRCYILMKMILKTFINPQCNDVLSSYMCKTVLFHCIQNTISNNWQQTNLLWCLICCLKLLQNFVRQENCPHFMIPENNLVTRRISPRNKQNILEILQNIIQSDGRALLEIPTDDLGRRLQVKMNMDEAFQHVIYQAPAEVSAIISYRLLIDMSTYITSNHQKLLRELMRDENGMMHVTLSNLMFKLTSLYREMDLNSLEKSAFVLLLAPLSSSLGSVIASQDIHMTESISPEALSWLSAGLNSDVSSGKLKLASALYCAGDMERAEFVLRNIEEKYYLNTVEPICGCFSQGAPCLRPEFINKCNSGNEELIKHIIAFCVRFTRYEMCCVPRQLQYEMFRSTQEDILDRDPNTDFWMDWAVVDSLPYLYFLQYKIYGHFHRVADQHWALSNFVAVIDTERNLQHRETALNLLGQCMEQEKRIKDALRCYMISLNIRARNNAAKFHICRLLYVFVNG
ncbi:uncharacterized protein LOC123548488 [Mercenaria mercenaria]|uniref:uncharacterized protein LOC123548488 n=1 Tax=Mercenaria mercenaria TaxID=6596 RepID=UPI00234F86BE|nr:uncharacterized protein LOC123548488 [Mercenaria mercenaria]